MAEWAADEKFLQKLADEGRGEFRRGAKLAAFLEQLPLPPAAKTKSRVDLAPDWTSASWSPFFVLFFVLFTGLLAGNGSCGGAGAWRERDSVGRINPPVRLCLTEVQSRSLVGLTSYMWGKPS